MKHIFLGDTHGRSQWKLINKEHLDADKFVFIGDYWDSFDIPFIDQLHNFEEIVEFKKANMGKIVLLLGNHDYIQGIDQSVVSGYQRKHAFHIEALMEEHEHLFQMAYIYDNILCTHAGVSSEWLSDNDWDEIQPIDEFVNDVWKYKPGQFEFNGTDPYGDNTWQTPIWIRPKSLMFANKHYKTGIGELIQIVGHTSMNSIDIEGKATGGKYYFIDTLETSGEYLINIDGQFKTGKV